MTCRGYAICAKYRSKYAVNARMLCVRNRRASAHIPAALCVLMCSRRANRRTRPVQHHAATAVGSAKPRWLCTQSQRASPADRKICSGNLRNDCELLSAMPGRQPVLSAYAFDQHTGDPRAQPRTSSYCRTPAGSSRDTAESSQVAALGAADAQIQIAVLGRRKPRSI